MLTFRLRMEFATQACNEAAAVLRTLIGPVRAEPGCSATRLSRDTDDGCGLTWEEEWRSIEDFKRHLRATAFRRILAVMELAAEPPVVEIDDVYSRRGFDLVEEMLGVTLAAGTDYETG